MLSVLRRLLSGGLEQFAPFAQPLWAALRKGLCDGLITIPDESYRVYNCV
jgi:hypothetical protein